MGMVAAGLAAAAFVVGAGGCGGSDGDGEASPAGGSSSATSVGVVEAWTETVDVRVRAVGTARSPESLTVTAEVSGTVHSLGFDHEEPVEAGQLLVQLDDRRARAELRAAQARLDRVERRVERLREAASAGAANVSELDDAESAFAEAEAEAELAKVIVDDHRITAPFDGTVGRRRVSTGALVRPGDEITTLQQLDPIEVEFSIPEIHAGRLRRGLSVAARTPAFEDKTFRGELAVGGLEVDRGSRSVRVHALVSNPDAMLRPGMSLNVELVSDRREDAVVVPEAAVLLEGTRATVFVVSDGHAVRRTVRVGERSEGLVEILSGVERGERVVTSGIQSIRDGSAVEAREDDDLSALGIRLGPREERRLAGETGEKAESERDVPKSEGGSG